MKYNLYAVGSWLLQPGQKDYLGGMNIDKQPSTPDADEELGDPYEHTVSTEEFVETVEHASQETRRT